MTAEPKSTFDPRRRRPTAERPTVGAPPDSDLLSSPPVSTRTTLAVVATPSSAETTPAAAVATPAGTSDTEHPTTSEQTLTAAAPGSEERLPGFKRSVGSRQIHTTLSAAAYALLDTARAEQQGRSYGDLVIHALRAARSILVAERPEVDDDPLARPPRSRRLVVEGRARSRQFTATASQAAAIAQLSEEAGIPNLSELVERAVLIAYGTPATTRVPT
jgi:hypothetical protein